MKKLTKTLLISGMAALAFGSVAAGTTYALFTSEAKNDVTITVGKVSVSTKVELVEAYHPAGIDADGTISDSTNDVANSDLKVDIAEDGKVSIGKMLPGDKVTLKVTPTNDSDVKIKYRETYEVVGNKVEGADLLKITGDEDMVKNWTVLEAGGEIDAYEVVIELPATETKRVDEVTIKLGLEAVQGNAVVYDVAVNNEDKLLEAINSDEASTSIKLEENIELTSILDVKHNLTIYGDGDTKLTVADKKDRIFDVDGEGDADKQIPGTDENVTITLVGLDLVGPDSTSDNRCISIWGTKNCTLILDNCTTSCSYYALNVAKNNTGLKLVIRNSEVSGYCAFQSWSSNVNATFENCTLTGENIYSYDPDGWNDFTNIKINSGYTGCEFTFNNCEFHMNSKNGNKQNIISIVTGGNTITMNDCTFYKKTGDEAESTIEADSIKDYLSINEGDKVVINGVTYSVED